MIKKDHVNSRTSRTQNILSPLSLAGRVTSMTQDLREPEEVWNEEREKNEKTTRVWYSPYREGG